MSHSDDTDRQNLIGRARELSPLIARRAEEAERLRRIPEDVDRALKDAGMLSLLRPRRYGGHQVDIGTYIEVLIELSRACGSVGWVTSQLNNNLWIVSQLEPRFREEMFAEPGTFISGVLFGQSTVRKVPDGYVIDGRWPFCSGCYQSNWILLTAFLEEGGGPPSPYFFVVPTREVELLDDWHVSGLAATNSNTVVVKELFVPASRVVQIGAVLMNQVTAAEVDAPLYRAAIMPFITTTAGSIAIGMAEAMLEEFKAQLPGRPITYMTYAARSEAPVTHLLLGEASVKIEAARLLFRSSAAEIERTALRDEPMPVPVRVEARAKITYGMRLCHEAVGALLNASGARALQLSNPLQRIERNLRALTLNPAFTLESNLEFHGRALLGLPPNTLFA